MLFLLVLLLIALGVAIARGLYEAWRPDRDLEGEPWDPRTPWCGNPRCPTHTWGQR